MLLNYTRAMGWASLFLLGVVIALPYWSFSGAKVGGRSGPGIVRPAFRRMGFHYWLAPLVALGSFVHAWIPMASHQMPRTNYNGLWIATAALGLILLQLGLGLTLRFGWSGAAKLLRRTHFLLMIGISALVLLHLWLNGEMFRGGS
jgi:hypothetical protein